MARFGTTLESQAMRTSAIFGTIAHRQEEGAAAIADATLTFEGYCRALRMDGATARSASEKGRVDASKSSDGDRFQAIDSTPNCTFLLRPAVVLVHIAN